MVELSAHVLHLLVDGNMVPLLFKYDQYFPQADKSLAYPTDLFTAALIQEPETMQRCALPTCSTVEADYRCDRFTLNTAYSQWPVSAR
ncbi:WD-repeat family protein [Giardia duodenalis]|uniref:WD-repeat family protein n=1 Tax=Giardia intestinalis TaxID=5741 RepID=V6TNY2_GIAIN|nr:WD-repeat family protein [Giardia intestinalis]